MMQSITSLIRELENAAEDLPNLDRSDLESRLEMLMSEAEGLLSYPASGLEDAIDALVQSIQDLYNEV